MKKLRSFKASFLDRIKALILLLSLLVATTIFIRIYCDIFDWGGAAAKKRLIDNSLLAFVVTPFLFWCSAYLCRRYSINASGHKMQNALDILKKSPNNFNTALEFLNIRVVIVKAFSSLVSTFGGGALGREGPSVHMSAGIFAVFANYYKELFPKINLRSWVVSGSAIGLALVFNAPIAAIIFAAEKFVKMGYKAFREGIFFAGFCVFVVAVLLCNCERMFNFYQVDFWSEFEVISFISLCLVCGVLGYLFKKGCNFLYLKFVVMKSNIWHLIPIIMGLMVAVINYYSGIYSFSGGVQTIQQAFNHSEAFLSLKEVGARFVSSILTFSSGSAGGLIAPAMAIGTGIGSILSLTLVVKLGSMMLLGMAGFLAVILGEPIAAAVIVFETTGQSLAALPFLVVIAVLSLLTWKFLEKRIGS